MAMGITCSCTLVPVVWFGAMPVQLQTSQLDYNTPCKIPRTVTSAGFEVVAFQFLPLQRGRSHLLRALEFQEVSLSSRMCHPQDEPLLGQRQSHKTDTQLVKTGFFSFQGKDKFIRKKKRKNKKLLPELPSLFSNFFFL